MKTLSLIGLLVLGLSAAAHGQGTIAFNNFSANVAGRVIGAPPSGYHVELMFAPIGGTNFASARILSVSNSSAQFFDGSTVFLTGIMAGTGNGDTNNVQLYIRGWLGPYADWNTALASGSFDLAQTQIFSNPTGGSGTALPANLIGWLGNNSLVFAPEPSSLSLMGLAAGAVWLFRRRRENRTG